MDLPYRPCAIQSSVASCLDMSGLSGNCPEILCNFHGPVRIVLSDHVPAIMIGSDSAVPKRSKTLNSDSSTTTGQQLRETKKEKYQVTYPSARPSVQKYLDISGKMMDGQSWKSVHGLLLQH